MSGLMPSEEESSAAMAGLDAPKALPPPKPDPVIRLADNSVVQASQLRFVSVAAPPPVRHSAVQQLRREIERLAAERAGAPPGAAGAGAAGAGAGGSTPVVLGAGKRDGDTDGSRRGSKDGSTPLPANAGPGRGPPAGPRGSLSMSGTIPSTGAATAAGLGGRGEPLRLVAPMGAPPTGQAPPAGAPAPPAPGALPMAMAMAGAPTRRALALPPLPAGAGRSLGGDGQGQGRSPEEAASALVSQALPGAVNGDGGASGGARGRPSLPPVGLAGRAGSLGPPLPLPALRTSSSSGSGSGGSGSSNGPGNGGGGIGGPAQHLEALGLRPLVLCPRLGVGRQWNRPCAARQLGLGLAQQVAAASAA